MDINFDNSLMILVVYCLRNANISRFFRMYVQVIPDIEHHYKPKNQNPKEETWWPVGSSPNSLSKSINSKLHVELPSGAYPSEAVSKPVRRGPPPTDTHVHKPKQTDLSSPFGFLKYTHGTKQSAWKLLQAVEIEQHWPFVW